MVRRAREASAVRLRSSSVIGNCPATPGSVSRRRAAPRVSVAGAKIQQNGSLVASGVQSVTVTAAAIDVGALAGGALGRFAIKNLDGTNNLTIQTAVASGVAFITLLPGEMAMGRFAAGVTAPAVVASAATVLMEYIVCEA